MSGRRSRWVWLSLGISAACGDDGGGDGFPAETAAQAIEDYKTLVARNYADVVTSAEALKTAVDAFVAKPSKATQLSAQEAWIKARKPYGPSEAFRFYDGPIDDPETGPEGAINAWPLDENYIDYTRDDANAGLINDVASTPKLTRAVIERANEAAGEKAISTGYHAIEFLLWGQDDDVPGTGAGKRPHTDYLSEGGTAANPERRGQYLSLVTEILVDDVKRLNDAWVPGEDNFAASFGDGGEGAQKEALGNILRSLGSLAKAELSGERMTVAYKNRSQEDEHSCFSDTTASDFLGNGLGIQNVWLGQYGKFDGVGLDDVVAKVDQGLAAQTSEDIATAVEKLERLVALQEHGKPIDVVIMAPDGSEERKAMLEAIQALKVAGDDVEQAATALGLSVQLEEPSETL